MTTKQTTKELVESLPDKTQIPYAEFTPTKFYPIKKTTTKYGVMEFQNCMTAEGFYVSFANAGDIEPSVIGKEVLVTPGKNQKGDDVGVGVSVCNAKDGKVYRSLSVSKSAAIVADGAEVRKATAAKPYGGGGVDYAKIREMIEEAIDKHCAQHHSNPDDIPF